MDKGYDSLKPIIILAFISLLISIVLFGVLESTGVFETKTGNFSGAAACFLFLLPSLAAWHWKLEKNRKELAKIKDLTVFIDFDDKINKHPPSEIQHYKNTKCTYSISSGGKTIGTNKEVEIKSDKYAGPYIHIENPDIEDAEFAITLEYNGQEWYSDNFAVKKRRTLLR